MNNDHVRYKRKINRRFLLIYAFTVVFSIIYASSYIFICYLIFRTDFKILNLYMIPALIGSLAIMSSLVPRFTRRGKVDPYGDANLTALTGEVSSKLGISARVEPVMMFELNAAAFTMGKDMKMGIGLPLLVIFDKYELGSVVAHEIAHHFQGDVRYGRNIARVETIFMRLMRALSNRFAAVVAWPYKFAGVRIFRLIRKMSRENEYGADAVAASLFGSEHTAGALDKLRRYERSWDDFLRDVVTFYSWVGVYVDIPLCFRYYLDVTRDYYERDRQYLRYASEMDTHPAIQERIDRIREREDLEPVIAIDGEISPDSEKLSSWFWSQVKPAAAPFDITGDTDSSLRVCCAAAVRKYRHIFDDFTFGDIERPIEMHSKVSYNLYQYTHVDDFEFEVSLISRIVALMIFSEVCDRDYRIDKFMMPVVVAGDGYCDVCALVNEKFTSRIEGWKETLASMGIDPRKRISDVDGLKLSGPVTQAADAVRA